MDLNMMMREHARNGLQAQLDAAVTNGDTEAARKIAKDMAALETASAPKPPPFTGDDVKAELEKLDWFGVDPKKSARVIELGKHMDLKKFATAKAFADAVVKAVDEEFKPAPGKTDDGEGDDPDVNIADDPGAVEAREKKPRRSDGPGEGDTAPGARRVASSGPWTKLSDAPAAVQAEIKRSADKFVPAKAPKEQRENFIAKALESQYQMHQRSKGKK